MLKIKITETGRKELSNLGFDIEKTLDRIIDFIPKTDLIGLDYIYITDKPDKWKKHLAKSSGAYFQKHKNTPAYIEIYLSRLFSHIKSAESMILMIPIQQIGLAQTLYHEIGHHVEKTRSHGVKKKMREKYAENYEKAIMSKYLIANADSINSCFDNLEKVADEKGLSQDIIQKMKTGWEAQYNRIQN